jgi:hypothetical protein
VLLHPDVVPLLPPREVAGQTLEVLATLLELPTVLEGSAVPEFSSTSLERGVSGKKPRGLPKAPSCLAVVDPSPR